MFEFRLESGDPHFEKIEAEKLTNAETFRIEEGDPHFVKSEGENIEYEEAWLLAANRNSKIWISISETPADLIFTHNGNLHFDHYIEIWHDDQRLCRFSTDISSGGWECASYWPLHRCCPSINATQVYFTSTCPQYLHKPAYLIYPPYDNYAAEGDDFWVINTTEENKHPVIRFTLEEDFSRFRALRFDGLVVNGTVELWGYSEKAEKDLLIGKTGRLPHLFLAPPKYKEFYIVLKDNVRFGKNSFIILDKRVKMEVIF
ncbi:MAG: hypothetical protein J7M38_10615 [Armatimonadetes bacterium]|nr:hypothetical protein [Armatimonadota bacterium]